MNPFAFYCIGLAKSSIQGKQKFMPFSTKSNSFINRWMLSAYSIIISFLSYRFSQIKYTRQAEIYFIFH